MSVACEIGKPQLEKVHSWCVTHNQMMRFCDPEPDTPAASMKQARGMVKDFWCSLPEYYQTLWLLENPCETLIENVFVALESSRGRTEQPND